MPDDPQTLPDSAPVVPALAESDDLDDLVNPDGTIKDSPANDEHDK